MSATILLAFLLGVRSGLPGLEEAVSKARTRPLVPQAKAPAWMDDAKVRAGYGFLAKHQEMAVRVLGTSSLAATFAAKDVAPVLMQTGRLPKDFDARMRETEGWVGEILDAPKDRADFVRREYARAVDLGRLHAAVAEAVRGPLGWNPKERLPLNGQAYAFVLYTFAWWPVEALVAGGAVDPAHDAAELDGWFHLWSVLGYGMGVPEDLLPRDYARAGQIVALLRRAQYAAPGEAPPDGIPTLLGGHVRMIAGRLYAQAKAAGKAPASPDALRPTAAFALVGLLRLSPGLTDALGLGPKPLPKLLEYAALPSPR